jgi:5-methylcytosine-specific restriction endonuclease McrA
MFALENNGINNSIRRECAGKCGVVLFVAHGTGLVSCDLCKEKAKRKARRMKAAENKRRKRGGKVHGVTYDPYAVFKRDKWKCYMCNNKTQKKNIYSHNAAEIDHVIPLSKGGKDIPSNVKCCCRRCNGEKGDRLIAVTGNLFCQT